MIYPAPRPRQVACWAVCARQFGKHSLKVAEIDVEFSFREPALTCFESRGQRKRDLRFSGCGDDLLAIEIVFRRVRSERIISGHDDARGAGHQSRGSRRTRGEPPAS